MKCPDCDAEATLHGTVPCLCDKDHCAGQRCGASDLRGRYTCPAGHTGISPEAQSYYDRHVEA